MKIATWNLKYAVAPRGKTPDLLDWAEREIDADVYAFTESHMPSDLHSRWHTQWDPSGVHPEKGRKWGTALATTRVHLEPVDEVKAGPRRRKLEFSWPAAVQVADIVVGRDVWGTIVGLYGVTRNLRGDDLKSGVFSVPHLLSQLEPLLNSSRGSRVIVAGDFNLWPAHLAGVADRHGLVDLIEATATTRPPLEKCSNCKEYRGTRRAGTQCGHLFTHRNGPKPKPGKVFGGMVQQIDYIWATPELARSVIRVSGGLQDFPDVWDLSDHAPVVAEFAE